MRWAAPVSPGRRASRSPSRPDLATSRDTTRSGAPTKRAVPSRSKEVEGFEREYPGASYLAARSLREVEEVGSQIAALVSRVARRHGLTHAALNALAVIEGAGGPIPTGELSARMHVTTGTMTSVLDTLERNGHILRLADPDDRRRVLVELTPHAQAVLDRVLPAVQQAVTAAAGGLSEATLNRLLADMATLRVRLAAVPDELPPPPPRRTPPRLGRSA